MLSRARKRILTVAIAVIALAAAIVVLWWRLEETYVQFHSPDGRYTIVVKRRPLPFAMPGGGGDAPGRALLVDQRGRVLHEAPVEMVNLVEIRAWRRGAVEVWPFGEWPLPE